jgi:hypothetical protein
MNLSLWCLKISNELSETAKHHIECDLLDVNDDHISDFLVRSYAALQLGLLNVQA